MYQIPFKARKWLFQDGYQIELTLVKKYQTAFNSEMLDFMERVLTGGRK